MLCGNQFASVKVSERHVFDQGLRSVAELVRAASDDLRARRIDSVLSLLVDDDDAFVHLVDDALKLCGARPFGSERRSGELFGAHALGNFRENQNQIAAPGAALARRPDRYVPVAPRSRLAFMLSVSRDEI